MANKKEIDSDDKFNATEYLIVSKNGQTLKTFQGKEINGLKKVELQKIIGESFGEDTYNISEKKIGIYKNKVYTLRGIIFDRKSMPTENKNELKFLLDRINLLESKISDNNFKLIEDKYNEREKLFELQIKNLKEEINEQSKYILDLEKESSGFDFNTILQLLPGLKGAKQQVSLADNQNTSIIPKEFLELFEKVNFESMNEAQRQQVYLIVKNFVQNLPLKEGIQI